MSFQSSGFNGEPNKNEQKPSTMRIVAWIIGGGIGAYFLISGIVGIIANGG